MSLKNLKNQAGSKPSAPTYDSLAQKVDQLSSQIARTQKAANDLQSKPDVTIFGRLQKTLDDCRQKTESYSQTLAELNKSDPSNPLQSQLSNDLNTLRHNLEDAEQTYKKVSPIHQQLAEEEEKKKKPEANQQEAPVEKTQEQIQAENQAHDLEVLQPAATEIVQDMQTLNSIAHDLQTKVQEQHEIVVKVNGTIEESKEEMVTGNSELQVAEEHQKSSTKTLIYILAIVLGICAVIGIVLGIYYGTKNKSKTS